MGACPEYRYHPGLVLRYIFRNIFNLVFAQRFQHFIKGSCFRLSGNDYPGILKAFGIALYIIIEFRNGFNGKGFVIVISIDDRARRNDEVGMHAVVFDDGLRGICGLRKTAVYSTQAKSQDDN